MLRLTLGRSRAGALRSVGGARPISVSLHLTRSVPRTVPRSAAQLLAAPRRLLSSNAKEVEIVSKAAPKAKPNGTTAIPWYLDWPPMRTLYSLSQYRLVRLPLRYGRIGFVLLSLYGIGYQVWHPPRSFATALPANTHHPTHPRLASHPPPAPPRPTNPVPNRAGSTIMSGIRRSSTASTSAARSCHPRPFFTITACRPTRRLPLLPRLGHLVLA